MLLLKGEGESDGVFCPSAPSRPDPPLGRSPADATTVIVVLRVLTLARIIKPVITGHCTGSGHSGPEEYPTKGKNQSKINVVLCTYYIIAAASHAAAKKIGKCHASSRVPDY